MSFAPPCYLMSADAGGKPVLIPAAEYERPTAQRIWDPANAVATSPRKRFGDGFYALYLNWCLSDDESRRYRYSPSSFEVT